MGGTVLQSPYITYPIDLDNGGNWVAQIIIEGNSATFGTSSLQFVAKDTGGVQGVADPAHQIGILVDDRYVVNFQGQMAGDVETDLSGAADDNLHKAVAFSVIARPPWPKNLAGKRASSTCKALLLFFVAHAQGFELAVQGRTLHANEFGRFRYVAAETGHLGHQVFALENFPRVA